MLSPARPVSLWRRLARGNRLWDGRRGPHMGTPAPGGTSPFDEKRATFAFQEYQMVADDTSKITDRRQTVNTLFVTINALFLTGVGYLLYLYFQAREGDLRIFF